MDHLLILGNRPLISLSNIMFAGLGSPIPKGVHLVSNRARFISALVSKHFFIVLLMNFIQASALPLL